MSPRLSFLRNETTVKAYSGMVSVVLNATMKRVRAIKNYKSAIRQHYGPQL